jgi:hypothetical protein
MIIIGVMVLKFRFRSINSKENPELDSLALSDGSTSFLVAVWLSGYHVHCSRIVDPGGLGFESHRWGLFIQPMDSVLPNFD